jgi:hypothetical protein
VRILGVDFTSAPRRAKPITVAIGDLRGEQLTIDRVEGIETFDGFERMLRMPGPWVGGFDFPFGLPRELVVALRWPLTWPALIAHFAALDRATIADAFAGFRSTRPAGAKYAHRAGDAASGAHPSMKLVNPPVAWMLHEGAPRLLEAAVHVPGLCEGDRRRVALEAYPGLAMRSIAAHAGPLRAPSYKNDVPSMQTPARRDARAFLVDGLQRGDHHRGVPVRIAGGLREAAIEDGSGDTLDAIAACAQAAWGAQRADRNYGLPDGIDPLEGWIVTA